MTAKRHELLGITDNIYLCTGMHSSLEQFGVFPKSNKFLRNKIQPDTPVIAITITANGNIKFHLIICIIWLYFADVPLDARPTQHNSTVKRCITLNLYKELEGYISQKCSFINA